MHVKQPCFPVVSSLRLLPRGYAEEARLRLVESDSESITGRAWFSPAQCLGPTAMWQKVRSAESDCAQACLGTVWGTKGQSGQSARVFVTKGRPLSVTGRDMLSTGLNHDDEQSSRYAQNHETVIRRRRSASSIRVLKVTRGAQVISGLTMHFHRRLNGLFTPET